MPSNDKQYYIYLRSTKDACPVPRRSLTITIVTSMLSGKDSSIMANVFVRKTSGLPVIWIVRPVRSIETTLFPWNTLFAMMKETKEQKRMR